MTSPVTTPLCQQIALPTAHVKSRLSPKCGRVGQHRRWSCTRHYGNGRNYANVTETAAQSWAKLFWPAFWNYTNTFHKVEISVWGTKADKRTKTTFSVIIQWFLRTSSGEINFGVCVLFIALLPTPPSPRKLCRQNRWLSTVFKSHTGSVGFPCCQNI